MNRRMLLARAGVRLYPLTWQRRHGDELLALLERVAWRERRRDLLVRICLPAVAVAAFAGLTALLLWARPAGPLPTGISGQALSAGTGLTAALAPRLVLRRLDAPEPLLRLGVRAALPLGAAMAVIAIATVAYAVALALSAPALAGTGTGPVGLATGPALGMQAAVMGLAAAAAALSAARARRVLQARAACGPGARG